MTKRRKQISPEEKIRVAPSLDSETHAMLIRLGVACGLNKTSMAEQIISIAVRTQDFVHYLQDINHAKEFRIITTKVNGKTIYMDATTEEEKRKVENR
jgi:hypothetical protein